MPRFPSGDLLGEFGRQHEIGHRYSSRSSLARASFASRSAIRAAAASLTSVLVNPSRRAWKDVQPEATQDAEPDVPLDSAPSVDASGDVGE